MLYKFISIVLLLVNKKNIIVHSGRGVIDGRVMFGCRNMLDSFYFFFVCLFACLFAIFDLFF